MTASGPPQPAKPGSEPDDFETKAELLRLLADGAVQGIDWYAPDNDRFASLVGRIAATDSLWMLRCIAWLRASEALAPAAIVGAVEMVRALLDTGGDAGGNRRIIDLVLQRADEPGAMLGYCLDRHGGRLSKPIQRGIADAAKRLYNEESATEFDLPGRGPRFADVLSTTHPKPDSRWQADFFRYLLQRRTSVTRPAPAPAEPMADPALGTVLADAARTGRTPF
ncbi:hypothetical protein E1287_14305 [Actinomadura sp. KC06]|uniref:hypothetical protein n=1 Tax=Actinomadura sp. KC06 TaxID=2530369 RepID=UPI00104FE00B|nr:hypothetical protein [Actinomadura sp. KC06]TDD35275.1 hypothetical protein E1287_14305 [Actinomadura sp. KC06]